MFIMTSSKFCSVSSTIGCFVGCRCIGCWRSGTGSSLSPGTIKNEYHWQIMICSHYYPVRPGSEIASCHVSSDPLRSIKKIPHINIMISFPCNDNIRREIRSHRCRRGRVSSTRGQNDVELLDEGARLDRSRALQIPLNPFQSNATLKI